MPHANTIKSLTAELESERKAFEQQRGELMSRYAGRYVAFRDGRVVDDDENDEALAQRMFKKFGDVPFYIGQVKDPPSAYEVPSPELVR